MHTLVMDLEPGYIGTEPGFLYRFNRDLYETITSSHLVLHTKPGRIKNFKLSGVTRQVETTGAQLFDAGTAKDSYYIKDDTGEESTTATQKDKFASDYIPVSGIESITFNAKTAWGAWYDASKLYISGFGSSSTGRTLVIPENAAYMRFTGNIENKNVIMLNAGDTALPWEPYTGATSSPSPEYPQDIQGVGVRTKNLFDKDAWYDFFYDKEQDIYWIDDDHTILRWRGSSGHDAANDTYYEFPIAKDVPENTWVTLSFDGRKTVLSENQETGIRIRQNGVTTGFASMLAEDGTDWVHKFVSVKVSGNLTLTMTYNSNGYCEFKNIQIEFSDHETPYEPYGYRTDVVCRTEDDTESYTAPIYTREPVYDGDSIQLVSGQYCHVQNSMTVDGASVKWVEQATDVTPFDDSYYSHAAVPGVLSAREYSNIKSTHFPKYETIKTANANGTFLYNGLLGARLLGITTLDAFKSWMAEHNPQFLLPRAEPRIDPLPAISQQALRNLPTYKGTTIIDTTDPLEPEITVSYRPQTDYSKLPGLEADYEKGIFTRLGAAKNLTAGTQFNRFPMYAGRRRCNVSDDGTITAYVGDPNYREDGSNGQVMVYQPKFYYQVVPLKLESQTDGIGYHLRRAQYWVSPKPQPEFKLHPAFINAEGVEVDYILLSAYEGSLYDTSAATYILDDAQVMDVEADKLCSISGARPASGSKQNFTRTAIEQLAQNRGPGWHGDLIKPVSAEQLLMIIEMGMMNLQTAIAQGVVSLPYAVGDDTTSSYAAATGSTSAIGNGTGRAQTTTTYEGGVAKEYTIDGKTSVCWRGKENFWGNIYNLVYGINIWGNGKMRGGQPYICNDFNFAESKNNGNYEGAGFTVANTNGYISAMGYSTKYDWLFIASETLGNSSLPVSDYMYVTPDLNAYRITPLGGYWNGGIGAGAFFWSLNSGVGYRNRGIGGRLIYVPQ